MAQPNNAEQQARRVSPWRDAKGNEIAEGDYLRCHGQRGVWVCYDGHAPTGADTKEDDRWFVDPVMLPLVGSRVALHEFLNGGGKRAFVIQRSTTMDREYKKLYRWLERNNVDAWGRPPRGFDGCPAGWVARALLAASVGPVWAVLDGLDCQHNHCNSCAF